MVIKKEIDMNKPLTDEQNKMLEALKNRPVQADEECPELTEEQLDQFVRISEMRRNERKKQTVTIRLSPQALKTAKSLGKGYTSVLSRILESALSDTELIKHYL
ncbi:MAG: BrnA antitoxin family protein [Oscillospiraceae bacterium]|nr:BrnA antitoxin family protein [Oscillospiraceae bacterium]